MCVADKILRVIVEHEALVESMEFDASILPSLLFAPDIVREKAAEVEYGRSVLRLRSGRVVAACESAERHSHRL